VVHFEKDANWAWQTGTDFCGWGRIQDGGAWNFLSGLDLAVNQRPAVKSPGADVVQQVWDFRKPPPLADLRQVGVANVF